MEAKNSFVLEVSRHDTSVSMSCFRYEELSSTIRHYGQRRVNFPEIDTLCRELIFILNKSTRKNPKDHALVNEFKKTGQMLWEHLLTKPVKDMLTKAAGGNLILLLDEELVSIPWELLHTHQEFLCLKFNVGRLMRARQQPAAPRYRDSTRTLSMLILANPTGDLPSAYREGAQIKEQCLRKKNHIRVDFKSTSIDTLYVKKNLCDYDIVHFAGHCEHERDNHRNTGWVLQDGRFTAGDVMSLGESVSFPSLVFSNACHSAGAPTGAIDTEYQLKTYSMASAFLFSGVRHYLGTIWKIEDPVSLLFARAFYNRVIKGGSVGEAVRDARCKVIKECGFQAMEWASYLLYGDPNFVVLRTYAKPKPHLAKLTRNMKVRKGIAARCAIGAAIVVLCVAAYTRLPVTNPGSYFLYRHARTLFFQGKNQEAIRTAGAIVSKDAFYLPAYPLLADTYERLGNKELALRYYFEYILASEKKNNHVALASAYLGIGWLYHGYGEFDRAYSFYAKALALSRRRNDRLNEAIALRKMAVWNIDEEAYDVALGLLTKSSEINRERQYLFEHRYNLACDYFDIGLVFVNKNDFEAAREFYTKSLRLFEKMKLKSGLSDFYFNLGEICLFEKEYQKAKEHYLRGLAIDKEQGNIPSLVSDFNMLGELYEEMDRFEEAKSSFEQSIVFSQRIGRVQELAQASLNLGLLYQKAAQKDLAKRYLLKAQELYFKIDPKEYRRAKEALQDLNPPQ